MYIPEEYSLYPSAIPAVLKKECTWTNWRYEQQGDFVTKTIDPVELTFERAMEVAKKNGDCGIALLLEDSRYCSVEFIGDEDSEEFISLINSGTYVEINQDDTGFVAIFKTKDNYFYLKDRIKIFDSGFIPLTGQVVSRKEPIENDHCIQEIINLSSYPSWLEGLPPNPTFTFLKRFLEECLATPNWDNNPTETHLYDFLALCWKYSDLQVLIHQQLTKDMWTGPRRTAFIKSITQRTQKTVENLETKNSEIEVDTTSSNSLSPFLDSSSDAIFHDPTRIYDTVNKIMKLFIDNNSHVWQRDGILVTIKTILRKADENEDEFEKHTLITKATKEYLCELATTLCVNYQTYKYVNEQYIYKPDRCPNSTIEYLMARNEYPFSVLSSVSSSPTLRRDGSIISKGGYDKATAIFFSPIREYPDYGDDFKPTLDDAKNAVATLRDVFSDVWFQNETDESAAIAAILTIMTRHLYRNAPLMSVTSTTAGIGKSLLVNCITLIATGEKFPFRGYPRSNEEMDKRMLSSGISGDSVIIFDNVSGSIGGDTLDQVLTESSFQGRLLGENREPVVEIKSTFFATGNNIKYRGDTARRVLRITIEARMQNPEQRTGFAKPRLLEWVREHHPDLHKAALTILSAYIAAGKPKQSISEYGSFEGWSDLVRGALVWAGMTDPYIDRESIESDSDMGFEDLRMLIHAWNALYQNDSTPRYLKDIVGDIQKSIKQQDVYKISELQIELGNALLAYDIRANGDVSKLSVRRVMHRLPVTDGKSRIVDNMQIDSLKDYRGTRMYFIRHIEQETASQRDDTQIVDSDDWLDSFMGDGNSDTEYMFDPDNELPDAPF